MCIGAIIKCDDCRRKTCLKTKILCAKMENWLHKRVEKQFWHGVESFLNRASIFHLRNKFYSVETQEDTEFQRGEI